LRPRSDAAAVDALAGLLAQAQAAQQASQLEQGLVLAEQAWSEAQDLGLLAEQIEAGRLRAFFLYRRGMLKELLPAGNALLPLLRGQGAGKSLCELLRWMTLAASEMGEFESAMRCASEGHSVAQQLGDVAQVALSLNALGACFERMGDPWQAERLMTEAAVLLRGKASVYETLVTLNNLCAVTLGAYYLLLDSGNDEECAAALARSLQYATEAQPHAKALGDAFPRVMTEGNLAEALLHSGRIDEAEVLLRKNLEQAQARGFIPQSWRIRCSLAQMQLLRGQTQEACDSLALLTQDMGDKAPVMTALRAHHLAYRAFKQLGRLGEALQHFEACGAIERHRSVVQLMAQSRFFVTRLETEQARSQIDHARREADQHHARAQALEERVQRDPLTGLGNRRFMETRIVPLMHEAEQLGKPVTLALIDADRFKTVNDQFGHQVGDRVLVQLAQMLREKTRGSDLLVRYGGDEFLVLFPETDTDRAFEVCDRLRQRVASYPWQDIAAGLEVTLSIGLATAPPYAVAQLIERADAAMYRAKHLGRNRVELD
jgi:diguanylate cyclase (GGDEF)-like protein